MKRSHRTCLTGLLVWVLVTGWADTVKVSYSSRSEAHLELDQPFAVWNGKRVQIDWTPSLHTESYKYLVKCDRIWLANSVHERGLRHEYKIAGKRTPLVAYDHNPGNTPQEKHYPTSGIVLGITAVEEQRPRTIPLLKLYDPFDPQVVRSAASHEPIASNYTATLAVLYSRPGKVAGSAFSSFLIP